MTTEQLDKIREAACRRHEAIKLGHGKDHILRTEKLALKLLDDTGDPNTAAAIALLHDIDDYKLTPEYQASHTIPDDPDRWANASRILDEAGISGPERQRILDGILTIGFSRRKEGVVPETPEAKAASDADMIDIMGAIGLVRLCEWHNGDISRVFDPESVPDPDKPREEYMRAQNDTIVGHMFEKVLLLPRYMLTEKGKLEAWIRWNFNVTFLRCLFHELDQPAWEQYLHDYLQNTILR